MDALLERLALPRLAEAQMAEIAFAAVLALLALGGGWLVRRYLGPRLSDWLDGRDLPGQGPLANRAPPFFGWLAALILAATAGALRIWDPYAALLLGIIVAFAAAATARNLVIGVGLGAGPALVAAGGVFVALLSHTVGGLTSLQQRLEAVGFTIGRFHFSLLSAVHIALTLLVLFLLVRIGNRIVHRFVRGDGGRELDATQQLLIEKIAGVVILVAAFFVGVDLLGIDLTAFAVFSGALGLAVGFGLQKTVGNLIAGIILLMDRSIKPGDVVVIADSVGRVNKIGVRAVSVITRDGMEHLVPNELMMTERVENWSYSNLEVRVRIKVGVSYDADLHLAQKLMIEAAAAAPRVLTDPAPVCWVTGFGNSSVDHELRFWIRDPEGGLGNIKGHVFMGIWDRFKEAGIELPYPQRDLHLRSLSPEALDAIGTALGERQNGKAPAPQDAERALDKSRD